MTERKVNLKRSSQPLATRDYRSLFAKEPSMSSIPGVARSATPQKSSPASHPFIRDAIIRALQCPLCREHLDQEPTRLHCPNGHSFDRAKQGYITLRSGGRTPQNADTPAMVLAREALLGTSFYEPIRTRAADMIAAETTHSGVRIVADLAGGTGYYLAGVLDRLPDALGVCIDLSTAALKRAARSHPRTTAVGADLSRLLPLADASVSVVTSFFGPRNVSEIRRVMRTDGILVVVTPTDQHLTELIEPLGMLRVDRRKDERLRTTLGSFAPLREERVEYRESVSRQQARALVSMGPSAHHVTPEQLDSRLSRLHTDAIATVSVNIRLYERDESDPG